MLSSFNAMTIRRKLAVAFSLVIVCAVGIGAFGLERMRAVHAATEVIGGEWFPSLQAVVSLEDSVMVHRARLLQMLSETDAGRAAESARRMDEVSRDISAQVDRYRARSRFDEGRSILMGFATRWAEYERVARELTESAQRIGDVVRMIRDIAGQTNLLALNATIEAARAGEAGKGFAVVASEVKSLAGQTGKATEEITEQIGAIQSATQQVVVAIQAIGSTIGEVNRIAASVAAAVDEQGAATQEIARSVGGAAQATRDVTTSIAEVRGAAKATGEAAQQVLRSASGVSGASTNLRTEVDRFLGSVRN